MTLSINERMLWDLPDCARDVLERAISYDCDNAYEVKDELWAAINDELIYYDDQWDLMKFYFTPEEADLNEAENKLYDDLWEAIDNGIIIEEEN